MPRQAESICLLIESYYSSTLLSLLAVRPSHRHRNDTSVMMMMFHKRILFALQIFYRLTIFYHSIRSKRSGYSRLELPWAQRKQCLNNRIAIGAVNEAMTKGNDRARWDERIPHGKPRQTLDGWQVPWSPQMDIVLIPLVTRAPKPQTPFHLMTIASIT